MTKMGIGDWGLGIGDWGLGPIPNPQSPIPQSPIPNGTFKLYIFNLIEILIIFFINNKNQLLLNGHN
jgi:hypothetical protein